MAKRVRIHGPGLAERGKTIRVEDDASEDFVRSLVVDGPHVLSDGNGDFFAWAGGPGCPFLFSLETFDPRAGSMIY